MKASAESVQAWLQDPQAQVSVIVHVDGLPSQYVEALNGVGLSVVRTFRLTNTIATKGPAGAVMDLLKEPWVVKIEPDRRITTMSG
jgi:hypothetical protein